MSSSNVVAFRKKVWDHYKRNGRHDLVWRLPSPKLRRGKKNFDPYRILVSEVMLQQTQVARVTEKYTEFLKAFPNVRALAKASLTDVLRVWSGMGYNRRAKYLRDSARTIVEKYGGRVPKDAAALRTLPGVGPYTASAARVFAFNEADVLIETNIRAAFIHHFFKIRTSDVRISDFEVLPRAQKAANGQDPRAWHWALMDYGVYVKRLHENPARKSAHYIKQSKFEGSLRQVRGAVLRELHNGPHAERSLRLRLNLNLGNVRPRRSNINDALEGLARDRLIVKVRPRRIGLGPKKGKWRIA